jgi:hypothetical protein
MLVFNDSICLIYVLVYIYIFLQFYQNVHIVKIYHLIDYLYIKDKKNCILIIQCKSK